MASYNSLNPPSGEDQHTSQHHLQAMYARLQAARNAQTQNNEDPLPVSAAAHDLLSRFHSYNQATNPHDYYGQGGDESPVTGLDDYPPPAAPTPPTGFGHPHSHHPPGVIGSLPPIGTMPPNSSSAEQSANLLNLLKFSGAHGQSSQPHSQGSPAGSTHAPSYGSSPHQTHPNTNSNPPPLHAPVPIPADPQGLLATLMKGNMQPEVPGPRAEHQQQNNARDSWNIGPPPANTQEYLLNLLHRPKPAQNDQPSTNESSQPATLTPQSANDSSADHYREYPPRHTLFDNASHDSTPLPQQFIPSPQLKYEYQSPPSQHSHHEAPHKSGRFDYTNPFEELASSQGKASKSPTPGSSGPVTTLPPELPAATTVKIIQKSSASAISSPGNVSDHKRSSAYHSPVLNTEPRPRPERYSSDTGRSRESPYAAASHSGPLYEHEPDQEDDHKQNRETVLDAITDLAEKADLEARDALARAEQEEAEAQEAHEAQAQIAADLEEMMNARTDAEFQESAEQAARDISKELEKEENAEVLETHYSPEVAQTIRDIVEDTAHGPVADSWESAEADEIVVIEEPPAPVKVYNFPMKPWISITMQDSFDEPRPQFRDEVILDIARLKKEFDQIDRNLVAATESYIAYGMSKAGGLRVIRQEDGKDAKLFTDTKDRVFNVAVSYTSDDGDIPPEESIIGTGISGTVYYIQIRGGGKDHLEESHPEQYGFALPPANTQEGDAPGGILKTRARTSATHPEYFAVGRGKTINIVWPAVVMQKNIFKPGHDRLVDTERLAKECALRINTGKAGKDFTFSQDDTTIVSLDKSGRVKFWDVRDLTAVDMNSDVRFPMPAHTSLEIKEPLMTLNTTPEGEKAWPTSVLLLDKQRPYQKRCALRYMIVGMKQNHTLQLWDLALGKPVQEFNLPHSKESDAVCSVMYHPATGMIVVGHPTRNSVYFLHLSAPKYTIKGLSQVDYIQKLVAKDSSIPEPDSTAVISGVREYSLANKGLLRSLDILESPSCSSSSEEPSLFDLYAMHSKGVTAVTIKQADLGWSKDNKVVLGVDATDAGLVKISKLKELPNTIVPESHTVDEPAAPIKIATRSAVKEIAASNTTSSTSGQETHKRTGESNASHLQAERKEAEAPVTPVNQLDKSEKKARKKREKAAAAAAAAAEKLAVENTQANTSNNVSRNDTMPTSKNSELKATSSPSVPPTMSTESIQSAVRQISSGLSEKLTAVITHELRDHRGKVESEFRNRSDSYAKSQKELLELVSSVLNENTQAVLSRTITDQFEDSVVPHLSNLITKTIETQIDSKLGGKVSHSVNNQLQKTLPHAVTHALQKADLTKSISERLAANVALDMEESFRETLVSSITPIFTDMAVASSRSLIQDVQRRTAEQIQEFEQRHIVDTQKIDQLTAIVSKLSDTVGEMAAAQTQFQEQFVQMQLRISQQRELPQPQPQPTQPVSNRAASYGSPSATSSNHGNHSNQLVPYPNSNHSNAKDAELQHLISSIAPFMERGEFETGLIRWIQLPRQHDIFDEYIVKFDPQIVRDMPALVSLSVASVLAEQLDGPHLRERVTWVELVLNSLYGSLPHVTDPAVREVVPKIMATVLERVEKLFMRISSRAPTDPMLPHLSNMTHVATRIQSYARNATY
ncbi:hypothetical protein F5B22DRAFT_425921 [Xylaria bambusicola]|uniref:uncharacterized protein n=1 Tax=Xylaria bambusicola TaxID=326684 RepID=UPI0020081840|nr:uncharacterized protein F5B22DRAFT_425921 [Xylaria bambusicola]KAI0508310.1 hypothetical protein F5B22DRAFT_425921 [Xylaria bambusicola]